MNSLPWVEEINKHPEKQHKSAGKQELTPLTGLQHLQIPDPRSYDLPNSTCVVHRSTFDTNTPIDVLSGKDALTNITGRMTLYTGLLTTDQNLELVGKENSCLM